MHRISLVLIGCIAIAYSAATALAAEKGYVRDVLVTSDAAIPEGYRPKPGEPIHYLFSQTRLSLGEVVAGIKFPSPEVTERAIVAELTKQGFIRAEVGGPMPQIYIVAVIGASNFEEPPVDYDAPLEDPNFVDFMNRVNARSLLEMNLLSEPLRIYRSGGLPALWDRRLAQSGDLLQAKALIIDQAMRLRQRESPRFRDREHVVTIVGGDKVNDAFERRAMSVSEARRVAFAANEDRLYVTLNAFDAARWARKERVLLWRTSMSIDARNDFAKELPAMLAHAGPLFGKDVAVPTFLNDQPRQNAEVTIGEVEVVPEEGDR